VHTSGLRSKFYEEDHDVVRSVRAVLAPTDGIRPALPVLSSGQAPGTMPATHAALSTNDLMILAGGGIVGHPDGAAAGLRAMHEAWAAGEAGEPLAERASRSPELARALAAFGGGDE
jgi:ribulose-bisphosphate carboxylase large chain